MAIEFITTDQTTTQFVDDTDIVFLLEGVTMTSAVDAFTNGGITTGAELFIDGDIYAANDAGNFASTTGSIAISTGAVSRIVAGGDGFTLDQNDPHIVTHAGEMRVDEAGFFFLGGDQSITVTGSIYSKGLGDKGALVFSNIGTGVRTLNNSGLLQTTETGSTSSGTVTNYAGTLNLFNSGDILSGGGTAVLARIGADLLNISNSGFIDGDILVSSGEGTVANSGLIDGDVLFQTIGNVTDDRYEGQGSGLVTGTVRGGDGDDRLIGGSQSDSLNGEGDNDTINGGGGDDFLVGEAGEDAMRGDAGDDSLSGGADNDDLNGGSGDDMLSGGTGNDLLIGGSGNDAASGDGGDDRFFGGTGDDDLNGGNDNDTLRGGSGNDELNGDSGSDFLFGNADNDLLSGGSGNDFLRGGTGVDVLQGDDGNDDLRGGTETDFLDGGLGRDRLYGGQGDDFFVYGNAGDSLVGATADTIFDFDQGSDLIDFDGLVAGELEWRDTGGFSGGGVASARYLTIATGVSVRVDADGNGTQDMAINVRGVTALTEDDFIL